MPTTSTVCSVGPCAAAAAAAVAHYSSTPWGGCSVTCGEGVRYRATRCVRKQDSEPADYSLCADVDRPSVSEECDAGPCVSPDDTTDYRYGVSAWGSCSATCDYGTRHRELFCTAGGLHTVHLQYCREQSAPETIETCQGRDGSGAALRCELGTAAPDEGTVSLREFKPSASSALVSAPAPAVASGRYELGMGAVSLEEVWPTFSYLVPQYGEEQSDASRYISYGILVMAY